MPATLRSDFALFGRAPAGYAKGSALTPRRRAAAIGFAFAGSGIYGASLSLLLPGWECASAALWLIVSAGLAWAIFIPVLALLHRLPLLWCLDAALVAITGGEVILLSGAAGNLAAWCACAGGNAATVNFSIVALSNVAMAVLLAGEMRRHGASTATTLAAWVLVLDGSGALFFALLHSLLHGA